MSSSAPTMSEMRSELLTGQPGILWLFLSLTVFYSHIGFFPQPDGTYI